jgi:flagellar biosynthesis chaperone FliJ
MAKFRLATLLKLRMRDRDIAAKSVLEVRNAIDKLNERQNEINESNREMDSYRKNASHGAVNLRQILDAQRFQMVLAAQTEQIADHQGKFTLLKAQQAVKSLEKLRDQREDSAQKHALGKQQERLDEWASIRHATQINQDIESSTTGALE